MSGKVNDDPFHKYLICKVLSENSFVEVEKRRVRTSSSSVRTEN